jgi:hypothetical protein
MKWLYMRRIPLKLIKDKHVYNKVSFQQPAFFKLQMPLIEVFLILI